MKILLINDNISEYEEWLTKLYDWFDANQAVIKFLSVDDVGYVQPFYNHLYVYFELNDAYLDFFILVWGKYIDHMGT